MDVSKVLDSLKIDTWYKALVYLGGVVLGCSLFLDVKGITNQQLQLLSSGVFLFGLGEWKNHKVIAGFKPPNAYTGPAAFMQTKVRGADFFGILLDLIGLALIGLGVWSLIK